MRSHNCPTCGQDLRLPADAWDRLQNLVRMGDEISRLRGEVARLIPSTDPGLRRRRFLPTGEDRPRLALLREGQRAYSKAAADAGLELKQNEVLEAKINKAVERDRQASTGELCDEDHSRDS